MMDAVDAPIARQMSLRAVTQALLSRGPTSRADLAKLTGLSKQTISEIVRDLEQGAIHGEQPLILLQDCVLRLGEDADQHVLVER